MAAVAELRARSGIDMAGPFPGVAQQMSPATLSNAQEADL
jgi:hypothetical protein